MSSALGKMMAAYHKKFGDILNSEKASFFPVTIPSTFFVTRPGPEIFSHTSSANLELLKAIQNYSELYEPLERLHNEWKVQTLIHGDFRWDNVIVVSKEDDDNSDDASSRSFQLKLVDWEFSDIGDPAWDIACALHEYLNFWLVSLPITGNEQPEQLIMSNNYLLQNIQAAMRGFWHTYIKTSKIDVHKSEYLLKRCIKFCALRLIQTVYEAMLSSAELTNTAVYMLQASANILKNTESAVVYLFGIPFQSSLQI